MKISEVKISKLKLAEYNPRKMTDKDLANLKKSLKRWGFVQPIVVNKDSTVIGGHQRIKAWKEMGNDSVPIMQIDITKKEEKALNLALNRISGDWDTDKLFSVINELRTDEMLDFTGFDEKEVSQILDQFLEEDEEEDLEKLLERLPAKANKGEVYKLGKHRLMCGDSTNIDDVQKLVKGKLMDMVWTDPPYNVNYKSEGLGNIENDNMSGGEFDDFMGGVFQRLFEVCKMGAVMYICTGWQSFSTFTAKMREIGLHISEVIIWVKNQAGIHTLEYPHKHEQIIKGKKYPVSKKKKGTAIIYGWKKGKHKYYGDRSDYDVWEVDKRETGKYVHPTEKPDWLVMKALKNSSKFNDNVIDLFGGSGSALMACEKLGRNCYIMEIDPRFIDVIIFRWEKYTKLNAKKL
jgi:DNA modification methylase